MEARATSAYRARGPDSQSPSTDPVPVAMEARATTVWPIPTLSSPCQRAQAAAHQAMAAKGTIAYPIARVAVNFPTPTLKGITMDKIVRNCISVYGSAAVDAVHAEAFNRLSKQGRGNPRSLIGEVFYGLKGESALLSTEKLGSPWIEFFQADSTPTALIFRSSDSSPEKFENHLAWFYSKVDPDVVLCNEFSTEDGRTLGTHLKYVEKGKICTIKVDAISPGYVSSTQAAIDLLCKDQPKYRKKLGDLIDTSLTTSLDSRLANPIDEYIANGIKFHEVDYLVELFPSPLPTEISEMEINDPDDLLMMSGHLGFDEIMVPLSANVRGEVNGKTLEFNAEDFVSWQVARVNDETIYHLAAKTDVTISDLWKGSDNENDDPDSWMNPYCISKEDYKRGLDLVREVRKMAGAELTRRIADGILSDQTGVLAWLETEIDDVEYIRQAYSSWEIPLMIVSQGSFHPYIEPGDESCLKREGYRLTRMYVRNYDEGEIT